MGKEAPKRESPKADTGKDAVQASASKAGTDTQKTEDLSERPAPSSSTPDSDDNADLKSAIADLLKKGDLGALADKVGVDRKAVDASSAKLRLSRKREEEAVSRAKDAETKLAEANELREAAKREYGAPHKAREAYDKGYFHEAAQWVSHVLGDDFATVTRNIANATKGMTPEALKQFQKERELKQREAALEAKERQREEKITEEQRTGRALQAIDSRCAGHDALKIKGGNKLIMRLLEDAFDPKTGKIGIGYKQAADRVLEEFLANAQALGLTRGAPEKKPDPPPKPKGPEPHRRREFPADRVGTDSAGDKRKGTSFEERAARAQRAFERGRP